MQALGIDKEFHQWGRLRNSRARMRDTQFSSKVWRVLMHVLKRPGSETETVAPSAAALCPLQAYGTHDYKEITIDGRVQFDLMIAIQREHKLTSYRYIVGR